MQRVVVFGRGAAGKSTLALVLAQTTGLPVIELDQHFWREDLRPLPEQEWIVLQERLAHSDRWIMEGDLGPYDVPAPRLRRADTVVVLDLSLARCAWRVARTLTRERRLLVVGHHLAIAQPPPGDGRRRRQRATGAGAPAPQPGAGAPLPLGRLERPR